MGHNTIGNNYVGALAGLCSVIPRSTKTMAMSAECGCTTSPGTHASLYTTTMTAPTVVGRIVVRSSSM